MKLQYRKQKKKPPAELAVDRAELQKSLLMRMTRDRFVGSREKTAGMWCRRCGKPRPN